MFFVSIEDAVPLQEISDFLLQPHVLLEGLVVLVVAGVRASEGGGSGLGPSLGFFAPMGIALEVALQSFGR